MRSRLTGFTLLELLVVLVIMGITVGFVILSLDIRSDKDIILEESKRLTALMQLATEEAVIHGRELALEFEGNYYRFLLLDNNNRWQALQADKALRPRNLPADLYVELLVEGIGKSSLDARGQLIYFYSSGEVSPFSLSLQDRQRRYLYTISGDAQGLIRYIEGKSHAG